MKALAGLPQEQRLRAAMVLGNLRLALPGLLLVTALLLFGVGLAVFGRLGVERDVAGARLQQGIGEVIHVRNTPLGRGREPRPGLVTLRVNGVPTQPVSAGVWLQAGQRVRVWYQVGKSGAVHVERVEPLPAPPAPFVRSIP